MYFVATKGLATATCRDGGASYDLWLSGVAKKAEECGVRQVGPRGQGVCARAQRSGEVLSRPGVNQPSSLQFELGMNGAICLDLPPT